LEEAIVEDARGHEFTIEHGGKKYIKDNPTVRLVCSDFRERVSWSQNWEGEPPRRLVQISGTGQIEDDEFALLGSPDSRTKKLAVSIRPMPECTLAEMRTLIDLRTEAEIVDPKQGTIDNAWPIDVGYSPPIPDLPRTGHNWYAAIYVPEDAFEELRRIVAPRMDLRLHLPAWGEPADLHLGIGWGRKLFLVEDKYGVSTRAWGLCEEIALTREGADRFAVPDPHDPDEQDRAMTVPALLAKVDGRLEGFDAHLKKIREALLALAIAAAVIAAALYFR
jgi:hypothetical protein